MNLQNVNNNLTIIEDGLTKILIKHKIDEFSELGQDIMKKIQEIKMEQNNIEIIKSLLSNFIK